MGAGQSAGAGSGATGSAEVRTSYYELLGVQRTATDDEIKKAYRRKALELHPDRNFGDVERTTALFSEVQSAYEVLSDPQERAWYDAHEGDILRGGSGEDHYEHNMRVTTADDIARMLGKFRRDVQFTDGPNGFFGFVREAFEQLAKEEEHAANYAGVDVPDYPSFGHKDDIYEDVVRHFYAMWNGFATKKTFAWKDVYRLSDAPDRRVRRLMEKENQKSREAGIREFNEAVRTLLQFVKKRDPRHISNNPTKATSLDETVLREASKKQAAKARAARAVQMEEAVPEWATRRNPDDEQEEEEGEIEEEHFECVACRKTFKSENQWEAHEKSKKHQKAIRSLKRKMQKDNAHLNLDGDVTSSGAITPVEAELPEAVEEADGPVESVEDVAEDVKNLDLKDTDNAKSNGNDDISSKEDNRAKKQAASSASPSTASEVSETDTGDEYTSRSDIEARLAGFGSSTEPSTVTAELDDLDLDIPASNAAPAPKLGKAAQKRAKKATKQTELDQSDLPQKCIGCNAAFSSKTQLFQHLKDFPKHAALKGGGGSKKKGKK